MSYQLGIAILTAVPALGKSLSVGPRHFIDEGVNPIGPLQSEVLSTAFERKKEKFYGFRQNVVANFIHLMFKSLK